MNDQQLEWDAADSIEFRRKVRELTAALSAASEAERAARSEYARARQARARAEAEIRAFVEGDSRPLPLFERSQDAEAQPAPGQVVDDPTPAPPEPPEPERDWEVSRVGGPVLGTVRAAGRNAAELAAHEAFDLSFGEMIVRVAPHGGRLDVTSVAVTVTPGAKDVEVQPGVTFTVWPDGKGARGAAAVAAFGNWGESEVHAYWPSDTMISALATAALGRGLSLRDWVVGTRDNPDLLSLVFDPAPYGEQDAGGLMPEATPGDRSAYYERLLLWHRLRGIPESPSDRNWRRHLTDWRRRQSQGDTEPRWDRWSEWHVQVAGQTVEVLYEPADGDFSTPHFQFYGNATSPTGYRSEHMIYADRAKLNAGLLPPLAEYAQALAETLAAECKAAEEKRQRKPRRKKGAVDAD